MIYLYMIAQKEISSKEEKDVVSMKFHLSFDNIEI